MLRWTRFDWTKVEKICFHDEMAIRISASKCPSVTFHDRKCVFTTVRACKFTNPDSFQQRILL